MDGAVGKRGSIAVIERFIRSLKDECTRRISVPLRKADFDREISSYLAWYAEARPHMSLGGRTPNEVYYGRQPANEAPRLETRLKYPRDAWCASPQAPVKGRRGVRVDIEVTLFEGRQHLPVIALKTVA